MITEQKNDLQRVPLERAIRHDGSEYLTYFRVGRRDLPLLVMISGGGHLARIFYGTRDCDRRDFLDHWLNALGFGVLAISYPCERPGGGSADATLSCSRWAKAVAAITHSIVRANGLSPEVVLVGWSMAGHLAPGFRREATRLGLIVKCFMSLAATPPMPGLGNRAAGGEKLTTSGFWDINAPLNDGTSRVSHWIEAIHSQSKRVGREIISERSYRCDILCCPPIQLRGESDRIRSGSVVQDIAAAVDDQSTFDFVDYPITVAIEPASIEDAAHALTDRLFWGALTGRALFERSVKK